MLRHHRTISTCLSNVSEESRCNACGVRACRRIFERFHEGASRADCVKAAVNYVVDTSAKTQLGTFWTVTADINTWRQRHKFNINAIYIDSAVRELLSDEITVRVQVVIS